MKTSMFLLILVLSAVAITQQTCIGNLKTRVKAAENAMAECEAGPVVTGREVTIERDTTRDKAVTATPVAIREEVVLPPVKKKATGTVPDSTASVAESTHSGPCECEELRINNFTRRFYDLTLKDDSAATIAIRASVYDNRLEPVELDYEGYRHTVREREIVTVEKEVERPMKAALYAGLGAAFITDIRERDFDKAFGWGPSFSFRPKNDQWLGGYQYDLFNRMHNVRFEAKVRLGRR